MSPNTYAAYYDNEIREKSSSGGIFSLLAKQFDIVYGVAMTSDCYGATFVRCESDFSAIRGSKYLQARLGDTFKQVKKDLSFGKTVLFTGTGCQINGLKLFLGKEYSNLLCVDVICHGVPSPLLWKKYIINIEKQYNKKVVDVNFRCKNFPTRKSLNANKEIVISKDEDPYMQLFLRDYCLRPSCYACKAKSNKLSDITIADFWGIEEVAPELDDEKGTSLIIVRTEKGNRIFEKISAKLRFVKVAYEDAVKRNPSEYSSVKKPTQRETFFEDANAMSFKQLCDTYIPSPPLSPKQHFKKKIKKILSTLLPKINWKNYGIKFAFQNRTTKETDGN